MLWLVSFGGLDDQNQSSMRTWKPESLPPFFPMLFLSSCEMMVAPGKGMMESSYELALFNSFLKTLDFSPSPTSEQSPSWSTPCDWFMPSSRFSLARVNMALPTVLFTPISTRRRLVCPLRRVELS